MQTYTALKPHYRETLRLGIPIAIGQVGFLIMGFADTMMVGHYSSYALAASSFVNSLFNLITFLLIGYSSGLSPLVSTRCGRGEQKEAGGLLKQALSANAIFGAVLLTVMGILYFFLDRMGQSEETMAHVPQYYLIILFSMIFVVFANAFRQFTDGTMDTATGMWVLFSGNALNVLGNALLIYGIGPFPEWGLFGAGVSTFFSRFYMVAAFICVILFRRRYRPFRIGWSMEKLNKRAMLEVNAASLPISLQLGMETASFTFSAVMVGWLGAITQAGYQVVMSIGALGFLFYYSFGASASIRIASFCGAKDWNNVRLAGLASNHILCMMAASACLVFLVFGSSLIRLVCPDEAVIAVAISLIPALMFYQIADALQICYANNLRGTGYVKPVMGVAFTSYILISIPCGLLFGFGFGWGADGIFLGIASGVFTAAPLYYRHFRHFLRRQGV